MARRRFFVLTPRRGSAAAENWSDYVRGEYWITVTPEGAFTDDKVEQASHEAVALDAMLAFKPIARWLVREKLATRADVRDAEGSVNRLLWGSGIELEDVPTEVGVTAAGGAEQWADLLEDVRDAYMKHRGVIMAADNNFAVHRLTGPQLAAIKDHLAKIMQQQGKTRTEADEVVVTQNDPYAAAIVPLDDFWDLRGPRQLWMTYDRRGLSPPTSRA